MDDGSDRMVRAFAAAFKGEEGIPSRKKLKFPVRITKGTLQESVGLPLSCTAPIAQEPYSTAEPFKDWLEIFRLTRKGVARTGYQVGIALIDPEDPDLGTFFTVEKI